MPVDDRWYLAKRGLDGERVKSERHGRGKRSRVRYTDAAGEPRERSFERQADAKAFDLAAQTGQPPETRIELAEKRLTFREYAERWRLSREAGWAVGTPPPDRLEPSQPGVPGDR